VNEMSGRVWFAGDGLKQRLALLPEDQRSHAIGHMLNALMGVVGGCVAPWLLPGHNSATTTAAVTLTLFHVLSFYRMFYVAINKDKAKKEAVEGQVPKPSAEGQVPKPSASAGSGGSAKKQQQQKKKGR
jgi:hypothetical protein